MIRFFTNSLSISTDVPCANEPFVAVEAPEGAAAGSDVPDCTSQSRGGMVAVVGVGNAAYGRPAEAATVPIGKEEGGAPPLAVFALDLKLVRRFWADDLRRIAGRWASMGAMDMTVLNAAMTVGDFDCVNTRRRANWVRRAWPACARRGGPGRGPFSGV